MQRVYLQLYKVADTPFHIQGGDFLYISLDTNFFACLLNNILKGQLSKSKISDRKILQAFEIGHVLCFLRCYHCVS